MNDIRNDAVARGRENASEIGSDDRDRAAVWVERAESLERLRESAMLRADVAALDAMLEDDVVYVHSNGVADTKARYLESLASGANVYRALSLEDVRVSAASDDVLVVTGRMIASIRKATGDIALSSRYAAVWVRRGAVWRLALFQGTKTPMESA
ncbi:nuclear transport factor 2 family protein [Pararobbsia silviterrae]|uniref:Nuclear transport factor 2 family protein n=1 Tax=Pararobbsia silviterrae TaxID=1792498 RepID=A0A494XSF4_9BURK|nr:nuclear transport factor 2 family protein [Pararobbsia silviterrae]RKP53572.1 nuclear transport factor 2 family protein [Pararobbsia silviterrae]